LVEISKTGLLVEKNNENRNQKLEDKYYDRFRDRIMFPIMDIMGNVIGYSARVSPGGDESQAKYVNTPETIVYSKSKVLYGISHAKNDIKQKNYVLLVEGNMDVIASSQAGLQNVVAVSGTALTSDQITIIKRYTDNIAMLFDMDNAGQQAAQKSADLCFQKGVNVKIVTLKDGKDAADVVAKDPKLLLQSARESVAAMEYFWNVALKKYDRNTADGKNNIAKDVIAHVANFENKIEKTHWIKKIAHELDVEENVINGVLQTISAVPERHFEQQPIITEQSSSFQKRSDIIRDSLTGVIMNNSKIWKDIFEKEMASDWIQNDSFLRFVLQKGQETDFSFDALLSSITDENAIERLRKIYFNTKYSFTQDGVFEYSEDDLQELAASYIIQYKKELQKEKLHSIIREIEQAEQKGDKETLSKLMSEFTKLSQETK
jgi:DNA primase